MTGSPSVQTPEAIAANPVRTSPPRSAKRRGVVTETKVAIRGLACSRLRSFMRPSWRFNETASRGNLSDARLLSMDACFAIGHRMFVANSHVRNCERRDQVFVGCVESSRRTGPPVVVRLEDSTHPTELDHLFHHTRLPHTEHHFRDAGPTSHLGNNWLNTSPDIADPPSKKHTHLPSPIRSVPYPPRWQADNHPSRDNCVISR